MTPLEGIDLKSIGIKVDQLLYNEYKCYACDEDLDYVECTCGRLPQDEQEKRLEKSAQFYYDLIAPLLMEVLAREVLAKCDAESVRNLGFGKCFGCTHQEDSDTILSQVTK